MLLGLSFVFGVGGKFLQIMIDGGMFRAKPWLSGTYLGVRGVL
jgi:hypothetical protein